MEWLKLLKVAAPLIAVFLLLTVTYQCGASHADAGLQEKIVELETGLSVKKAELQGCREANDEVMRQRAEADRKLTEQGVEYDRKAEAMQEQFRIERDRVASSYARRLEEARAESQELRVRIAEMEPGLACLTVVEELANALQ